MGFADSGDYPVYSDKKGCQIAMGIVRWYRHSNTSDLERDDFICLL